MERHCLVSLSWEEAAEHGVDFWMVWWIGLIGAIAATVF